MSRTLHVLEMIPTAKINAKRLGVTRFLLNGKRALVGGAFEERIALTILKSLVPVAQLAGDSQTLNSLKDKLFKQPPRSLWKTSGFPKNSQITPLEWIFCLRPQHACGLNRTSRPIRRRELRLLVVGSMELLWLHEDWK